MAFFCAPGDMTLSTFSNLIGRDSLSTAPSERLACGSDPVDSLPHERRSPRRGVFRNPEPIEHRSSVAALASAISMLRFQPTATQRPRATRIVGRPTVGISGCCTSARTLSAARAPIAAVLLGRYYAFISSARFWGYEVLTNASSAGAGCTRAPGPLACGTVSFGRPFYVMSRWRHAIPMRMPASREGTIGMKCYGAIQVQRRSACTIR